MMTRFGFVTEYLKNQRKKKNLSQEELGEKIDIPQSHISQIERGEVDLKLSTLLAWAHALDLEVILVDKQDLSAIKEERSLLEKAAALQGVQETAELLEQTCTVIDHTSGIFEFKQQMEEMNRKLASLVNFRPVTAGDMVDLAQLTATSKQFAEAVKKLTTTSNMLAISGNSQTLSRHGDSLKNAALVQLAPEISRPLSAFNKLYNSLHSRFSLQKSSAPRPAYQVDEEDDDENS